MDTLFQNILHRFFFLVIILGLANAQEVLAQTTTENYVKTTTYRVETQDGNVGADEKIEQVNYYDGIGRPLQSITKQAGGNHEDLIVPNVYDEFGRQTKSYLPYVRSNSSLNFDTTLLPDSNGNITPINNFYDAKYPDEWNSGDAVNPYSQSYHDSSPLNRVLEQGAPGKDWVVNISSDTDHTIKFEYHTNTTSDYVRKFGVVFINGNTESPELDDQGLYSANELYRTVTKDENWQPGQYKPTDFTTEEFKDKEGRVVLKRTYDNGKWHDTYYVYDDFGNLTYVLPPKLATYASFWQSEASSQSVYVNTNNFYDYISGSFNGSYGNLSFNSYSETIRFNGYAYTYGGNSVSIVSFREGNVLDLNLGVDLDGLVLTGTMTGTHQGSNFSRSVSATIQGDELHLNSDFGDLLDTTYYSFSISASLEGVDVTPPDVTSTDLEALAYQYKYDNRNRLVEKKIPGKGWEYIMYNKLDQPVMTQDANLKSQSKCLFTTYDAIGRVAYTGEMHFPNYLPSRTMLQTSINSSTNPQFVTKSSTPQSIAGTNVYYTSQEGFFEDYISKIFTINYYDDYNFDIGAGTSESSYGITPTTNTKSLATGSKVRVLDTDDWITTVMYYDDKARPIYNYSHNAYLGTTDKVKSKLDFQGLVEESESQHTKSGVTVTVEDDYTYDHANRLLSQKQTVNNGPEELIAKNHYDDLGQLVKKDVGNNEVSPLQEVDYAYNIRGWLKSINAPEQLHNSNDLFSFGLNYNKPEGPTTSTWYNKPLYNGNISHAYWMTDNVESNLSHYSYKYDALNRFRYSYYAENDRYNNKFNTYVYGYDRNGNIDRLVRYTKNPNSSWGTGMDYLTYIYDSGNKLTSVKDNYNNTTANNLGGFVDGNTTGDDYEYDANGNMTKDLNKNIGNNPSDITYNHLNLPKKIYGNNGYGYIEYTYSADGTKLEKKLVQYAQPTTTTKYAGNYIYKEDNIGESLQFFNHPEGYVEQDNGGGFDYIYQYKDHLGNIRLSYKDANNDGEVTGASEQIFYDGFESVSGWDGSGNSWGHTITGFDSNFKKFGNYSGYIDRSAGNSSETAVHSNEWVNINISEPTDFVVSAWVYLENTYPNGADLFLFMKTNQETAYYTAVDYVRTSIRGKWVYIEKKVTVQPNIDKLNVRIDNNGNGNVWFDDVSVRQMNPDTEIEIVEESNYYPFGLKLKGYNNVINGTHHPYGFGGKEEQKELGLEWLDFSARNYDPTIGRWMNVDPLAELDYSLTSYNYTMNNPILLADPTGLSTHVKLNKDGEWEVVEGGDPDDDDNNIYIIAYDKNGENATNTGISIGESLTSHSFFDDDNNAVAGAIIDLESTEGQDFIDDEIIEDHPFIGNYMSNGTGGLHYDFKERGIKEARKKGKTDIQHRYRGSKASNGKIGSARDFGNGAAGIVAGRFGLSWRGARLGFDALETKQHSSIITIGIPGGGTIIIPNINFTSEKLPTQKAQKLGWEIGIKLNEEDGKIDFFKKK